MDPLGASPENISWSSYSYVWGNPVSTIDPDGRSGETVNNEYIRDIKTGETVQISTVGGDEVDIVYYGRVHENGAFEVVSQDVIDVSVEHVGGGFLQETYREPGLSRTHHYFGRQSVATLDGADDPIFSLLTLGLTSSAFNRLFAAKDLTTLGFAKIPRVRSSKLRRLWEKATGKKWPKEPEYLPDGSPNPYYKGGKRNQSVSHKKALEDGGTNEVHNIEPEPWKLHHQRHIEQGDFRRWGKRKKN